MLTVESVRKAFKQLDEQTKDIRFYFFISREMGEHYGLKDGELLLNGTVQVIFLKKIKVA